MSSEERVKAEPCAGTFSGCLVEGDAEENAREKKIKRRAVGISIVLQSAGLAVLVIAPLLAKQPELVGRSAVPIPPYSHSAVHRHSDPNPHQPTGPKCVFCPGIPAPITAGRVFNDQRFENVNGPEIPGTNENTDSSIPILDNRRQPSPPPNGDDRKKRVVVGHIDPALLIHRVEPVFPALPKQLRKNGKVELHAVIGTDGSIQELHVVSGDPLFVDSALEAVRQWHYRPTSLNGQPVEIDTFITVIYTLQ